MIKQLKQINPSQVGFTFTKAERNQYGLIIGDYIDLGDMIIIKREEKTNEEKQDD